MSKTKKVIIVFLILLLILFVAFMAAFYFRDNETLNGFRHIQGEKPGELFESSADECEDRNDWLTVSPLKSEDYTNILPLGNLSPTGHVFPTLHTYFIIKREVDDDTYGKENPSLEVPLFAPGDVVINNITSSHNKTQEVFDYGINFFPCQKLKFYFLHVASLSDKLQKGIEESKEKENYDCHEYKTGGNTYEHCSYNLELKISAGEQIGTAGKGANNLDMGARDTRQEKLVYANSARWHDRHFYVVCPADYFSENIKQEMKGRYGGYNRDSKRTKEPVCGEVAVDVPGTAQGIWFYNLEGKMEGGEDPHLALAPHNYETEKQVFSVGNSAMESGIRGGAYFFVPAESGLVNKSFSQVIGGGQVYCYEVYAKDNENNKQVFLISLPDAEALHIKKQAGKITCDQAPWKMGRGYTEFKR